MVGHNTTSSCHLRPTLSRKLLPQTFAQQPTGQLFGDTLIGMSGGVSPSPSFDQEEEEEEEGETGSEAVICLLAQ